MKTHRDSPAGYASPPPRSSSTRRASASAPEFDPPRLRPRAPVRPAAPPPPRSSSTRRASASALAMTTRRDSPAGSSSAAPPPLESFLLGKLVRFSCRALSFNACVDGADRNPDGSAHVGLSIAEAVPKRGFSHGEQMVFVTADGRRWSGTIDSRPKNLEDWPALCNVVQVHVPDAEGMFTEPDLILKVDPILKKTNTAPQTRCNPWKVPRVPQGEIIEDLSQQEAERAGKIKIGINGFGTMGRMVAEIALQSVDVELVAISDYATTLSQMVRVWNSTNISVRVLNYRTLLFKNMYHSELPEEEEKSVVVFQISDQNTIPWDEFGVDYIVDCANVNKVNKNTVVYAESAECLRYLPKVIHAFGLTFNKTMSTSARASFLSIVTNSTSALKAVMESFPEWDGEPSSRLFHADGSAVQISDVELIVRLEKSGTQKATTNSKLSGADATKSLSAILSFCVEMIRMVPIRGCHLELF